MQPIDTRGGEGYASTNPVCVPFVYVLDSLLGELGGQKKSIPVLEQKMKSPLRDKLHRTSTMNFI